MKKAIVPLWIGLFFSFLAIALLLMFYFIFVRIGTSHQEIPAGDSLRTAALSMLLSYSNSRVELDGESITFADLIRKMWIANHALCPKDKYGLIFQTKTREFLQNAILPVWWDNDKKVLQAYPLLFICTRLPQVLTDCIIIDQAVTECRQPENINIDVLRDRGMFVPVSDTETLYLVISAGKRR